MKTSISFRKTVMLRTYHIMEETGKNWADCIRKVRINKAMHRGEVTFYFEKAGAKLERLLTI
ncbi:hypothetical protein BBI01_09375 [Chryseobacterium artocarpi]|uniref:Uncharacterized protein n=1 Tax=Chryseobacterium artocarpi TaxID=1414727 RepID=A0A1B8ZL47_9FLAO|nr:hypothetical protein BBI01_09375 [Chryseobacterium artocarpi]